MIALPNNWLDRPKLKSFYVEKFLDKDMHVCLIAYKSFYDSIGIKYTELSLYMTLVLLATKIASPL